MSASLLLLRSALAALLLLGGTSAALAQSVFINELHYENNGEDAFEGTEIAGPAGTDLGGWEILYYNGNNGKVYSQVGFGEGILLPEDEKGCGTRAQLFAPEVKQVKNGLHGVALVDPDGNVVQFLSYEGTFMATEDAASGMTSTDIGVSESNSTQLMESMQLKGTGSTYTDFTWESGVAATPNAVNANQTFDACAPQLRVEKVDSLGNDVYGDGKYSPGDTIHYTITIENLVGDKAKGVQFSDTPDAKTSLVVGSVTTDKGNAEILQGNGPGETAVEIDLKRINQGNTVTVEFDVKIDDPLTQGEIAVGVSNQGEISGDNFDPILTDDPDYMAQPCEANGMGPHATFTPLSDICDGVVVTNACRVNGSAPGPCQGTNEADVIIGSPGNDVIKGRGGDDNIVGLAGRDLICADGGDDFVEGDDGRDRIDGGAGDDILRGGAQNDVLSAGAGDDDVSGDDGRDTLAGGIGEDDLLDGGRGSDKCTDEDGAIFVRCGKSCGLGFELVGLLPALVWARSRRRAARG